MNWKKVLLVIAGLGLAFVLMVSIGLGLLAAAGVATAVAVADAIDEAGGLTITDGDGETFSLDVGEGGGITFSDGEGEALSIDVSEAGGISFSERDGDSVLVEVNPLRITVAEGEDGSTRVIVPDFDGRIGPLFDGPDGWLTVQVPDRIHYRNDFGFAPLGFFIRTMTVLAGLGLLTLGGYLLLRNRKQEPKEPKGA
jgi:hypothetical protein